MNTPNFQQIFNSILQYPCRNYFRTQADTHSKQYQKFNDERVIQKFTQILNQFDEEIDTQQELLFKALPQGADLQLLVIGSLHRDWQVEQLINLDTLVDMSEMNFAIDSSKKKQIQDCQQFSEISVEQQTQVSENYQQKISFYQFCPEKDAPTHFFSAFSTLKYFSSPQLWYQSLLYLKEYAQNNSILYLEIMYDQQDYKQNLFDQGLQQKYSPVLEEINIMKDEERLEQIVIEIYKLVQNDQNFQQNIINTLEKIEADHQLLNLDEQSVFYIRYVAHSFRNQPIFQFLMENFFNFQAVSTPGYSDLLVAVKSIGQEDRLDSLTYYWIQMRIFSIFKRLFPAVQLSLHAGEINEKLVDPSHYNHINDAVFLAQAQRIGLGNGIQLERNYQSLLKHMQINSIGVELCLKCNFWLLGDNYLKNAFFTYFEAGVPIIISTDNVGNFCTDISQEYRQIAHMINFKYPEYDTFKELKEISLNGIQYSFMKDLQLKKHLYEILDKNYDQFYEKNKLNLKKINNF